MRGSVKILRVLLFCVITAVAASAGALAQTSNIQFTSLSSKDGLSSNTVHAILKDKYGLLWFATDDGLNKFDGTRFKTYRHNANDTTSLETNEIAALYEDGAGELWVGVVGGSLHKYDRQHDCFKRIRARQKNKSYNLINVKAIACDKSGKLWLATFAGLHVLDPATSQINRFEADKQLPPVLKNGITLSVYRDHKNRMWVGTRAGLYRYDDAYGHFTSYLHNDADVLSIAGNAIKTITQDAFGNLWFGTTDGLSMLSANEQAFKNYKYSSKNAENSISSNTIYAVAAKSKNELWVGTENGLDIINTSSGNISRFGPDNRNSFSLTSKSIRSILIDKQGICWIGTYQGGINKYDQNLTFFSLKKSNPFDPNGLSAPFVTSFAEGTNGNIYVGTDGGGLNLFNPQTRLLNHVPIKSKLANVTPGVSILTLIKAKNNRLWIGTYQNGLFGYDIKTGAYQQFIKDGSKASLSSNDIFCLMEDKRGKLWIGTNGAGVNVLDPVTGIVDSKLPEEILGQVPRTLHNGFIRAFEEDKHGNIWIGTNGGGINIYNPETKHYTILQRSNKTFPSDKINTIYEDRHGVLWIGTNDEGLVSIDESRKYLRIFNERNGLPNNVILKVIEDQNGKIWVTTNKGVSALDVAKKSFVSYNSFNGLQNNAFIQGAAFAAGNGQLYFGGADGFNYLMPSEVKINKNVPPVLFTNLTISGKTVSSTDKSHLNEDITVAEKFTVDYKQSFALSYVAVNYTSPKQNHYAYRLKGFEKDWIDAGSNTMVYYTNLNPGEYVFEVKASNNDGVWNNTGKSIKIIVKPPFWLTWYAYIIYIASAIGVLLYIRHRGILQLQQEFKHEQEKREQERLRELDQSKIKFLTNLSHEFRTPIALIMAPADKLLNQPVDIQTSAQVNIIKRNARRLLNMVNQLLDFRKLEEQELKLCTAEGDVIAFLKDVSESFRDLSEKKRITFVFNSGLEGLLMRFDHDKLERVLFNLLSNAFKFTPEGGKVMLAVYLRTDAEQNQQGNLVIEVSDTGIGIGANQQAQIFERFFQSDQSPAILNQGSGIGLSIVREFVIMHRGTINVKSEPGQGSIFTVELPYDAVNLPLQSTPESLTEQHDLTVTGIETESGEQPLLLIIDDNEEFRFYLKDHLKANYRIIEAANGKEGWQQALAHHPELIISDMMMPFMDGVELSKKLKADKRTSHIPVMLLTASTSEREQMQGLTSGVNDYLTKPFSFNILNAKIRNMLAFSRNLKKAYSKQLNIASPEVEIEQAGERFIKSVIDYVKSNLNNTQLSVEDLSRHVGMSRGSLYNKILEVTGQTPVEFIRTMKLEQAALLLEKSDMNIAQIAYAVGFTTPNYFAKSFKSKYNMLPSEYLNLKRKAFEIK
ncbi:two-component regulator propeller domain-containing protein [Mucilaginibacter sp. CSA2-8R]|uniref:two-component regulator propeller domain-containing protein n=1 Tax=Mucilaginibacter sp. CSA2-8R TaxID=3141542 RepID=UPI00315DACB1